MLCYNLVFISFFTQGYHIVYIYPDVIFLDSFSMFQAYDITSCDLSCDCGVTCFFIIQKKKKRKKNQYKIKEKKNKIVSVQASYNNIIANILKCKSINLIILIFYYCIYSRLLSIIEVIIYNFIKLVRNIKFSS